MYEKGDVIVYGNTGVCEVAEITSAKKLGMGGDRPYYVLQPLNGDCMIYTPVDTGVFMRPVISADEAEFLISQIPNISGEAFFSSKAQELTQHYQSAIVTHDCEDLIKLAKSLYAKKKYVEEHNHKFGQVDEKFMHQAEELLCSEFSVALGIPVDKVMDYIAERVENAQNK